MLGRKIDQMERDNRRVVLIEAEAEPPGPDGDLFAGKNEGIDWHGERGNFWLIGLVGWSELVEGAIFYSIEEPKGGEFLTFFQFDWKNGE